MELEQEISTKFEDSYHKALVNILYTNGWLTSILKQRLAPEDITPQQYNVLRILRGRRPQPATINLLRERMLDKMSDASRIVDRLVTKGLAARGINGDDRRAVDITITKKGLDVLKSLESAMNSEDIFGGALTQEEADRLSFILDKLRGI